MPWSDPRDGDHSPLLVPETLVTELLEMLTDAARAGIDGADSPRAGLASIAMANLGFAWLPVPTSLMFNASAAVLASAAAEAEARGPTPPLLRPHEHVPRGGQHPGNRRARHHPPRPSTSPLRGTAPGHPCYR